MSLRAKITAAFTILVVGGTAISTLIGSRIITDALLEEASRRAVHGLDAAQMVYREALENTSDAVGRAAASGGVAGPSAEPGRLDFLAVVAPGARGSGDACLDSPSMHAMVAAASQGRRSAAAEVLSPACLSARHSVLLARARTEIVPGPANKAPTGETLASGLALTAAAPIVDPQGRVTGVAYGGNLLNGRPEIVDRVRLLVYGSDLYGGRPIGAASILLGDVRVATNVMMPSGQRAIGTRASADVRRAVLDGGQRWNGRTFVFDDWYIAAYEPLRNYSGHPVGMLYVGVLEAPILDVRTNVMLTFLVVCVLGLVVVFALTYAITRRTISPLEEIVVATRKIAAGDLSVRVSVDSNDEIGDLAGSFNDMLTSLQRSNTELEEWGRTLEERVRERTAQLVAVQEQMVRSEKLASIGRLAAGVAHSINNPLGGILSLSMLAEEGCQDPALAKDLDTIAKQALRCREIVKGLLEFSRQTEARVARIDVNEILEAAVLLLQRQAVFHNVSIERHFGQALPAVLVDPGQLQEVVTNLMVNAVDAMEHGGTLTIETAAHAPAGRDRADVMIRVADSGKGIAPEIMPYLFEPFFTTKVVGKGTGLGLAIAHGVVTRAGGRIEVSSSPGRTVFTIHLPAAPEEETDVAAEVAGGGARKSAPGF